MFLFSSLADLCFSMLTLTNILAFLFFLLMCYLAKFCQRQRTVYKNIPPGPKPWPIIGNLPIVLSLAWKVGKRSNGTNSIVFDAVTNQARVYGNIYSLFIGSQLVVVFDGFDTVKDALLNHPEVFSDRPDLPLINILTKRQGIAFAPYGPAWKKQRKFCLTSLRNFGVGKLSLEPSIQEMLASMKGELLKRSEKSGSAGLDPSSLVSNLSTNIICSLIFNKNYHHDDPDFQTISQLMTREMNILANSSAILINIFPLLYSFPFGVFKELRQVERDVVTFFMKIIAMHRSVLDPDNPRDLTDLYLLETMNQKANGEEESEFTDEVLYQIIVDLFFAGSGTTTNTILWFLLNMILHPDIQDKVQAEIDEVVGKERAPSMTDKGKLPFTEATIMEVERMYAVVPLSVPHMASETTVFRGYTIPKGTIILPSLWSVHRDPTVWDDPDTFNPMRFLDDEGHLIKKEYFVPFGLGRRVCMGEQLGKMSLFLTLSTLMQAFKFRVPEGQPPPSLQGCFGVALAPCPYTVCVTARGCISGEDSSV